MLDEVGGKEHVEAFRREVIFFQGEASYVKTAFGAGVSGGGGNLDAAYVPAPVTEFFKEGAGGAANVKNAGFFR
jgi:hypothetical protein